MAIVIPPSTPHASGFDSFAQLLESLGDVPLHRIRANPPPGAAVPADVLAIYHTQRRLYELIDGVLVEKSMGYYESVLASIISHIIATFLDQHALGVLAGADGMIQFSTGIRIPDVSFVSWRNLPSTDILRKPILAVAPDLAVEVLSANNTRSEMTRKLREYFDAGVRIVWYLDPESRTLKAFIGVEQSKIIDETGAVDGGDVLPGVEVRLADVFARAERPY